MSKSTSAGGPARYPDATAPRAPSCVPSSPLSERQISFTILIIEDNRVFREFLKGALQSRFPFLTLATAAGAQDALAQINTVRPDVIFMDVRLPDGNGFELTRCIREMAVDANVVVFTSFDLPEYRDEAFRSGADHYLVKGAASINDIFSLVESIATSHGTRSRSRLPGGSGGN